MRHIYSILLLTVMTLSAGCGRSAKAFEDDPAAQADSLYNSSLRLIDAYTDSLHAASDSASIEGAREGLDLQMRKLYMRFPPLADTLLEAHQQQVIHSRLERFVVMYGEKSGRTVKETADTVGDE